MTAKILCEIIRQWAFPVYTACVRTRSFHKKRSRYCLVTAAWNEPEAPRLYREILAAKGDVDFFVAARGDFLDVYSDETLRDEFGIRTLISVDEPGQSLAYRRAFELALDDGYEGIVMIDSNGKDDPRALDLFVSKLDEGFDLVQASRFMKGGHHQNTPVFRSVCIRAIAPAILWLGCGYWYGDQTNGFKGFSRRFLEDPRVHPLRPIFVFHNLQIFLNYAAPKFGFRVCEVPTSRVYPKGKVPTKISSTRALLCLFHDYVKVSSGRLNP